MSLVSRSAEVQLDWTAESLVTRALRPGATVDLVAEYRVHGGGTITGELLSRGRVPPSGASMRFALPSELKQVPAGPVCLRLRIGNSALPLRGAGPGASTDGFHYAAWDQSVVGSSRRASLEREREALSGQAGRDAEALAAFAAWKQRSGVPGAAGCASMSDAAAVATRPLNVVDSSEHEVESRRECVYRYKLFAGGNALPLATEIEGMLMARAAAIRGLGSKAPQEEARLVAAKLDQARSLRAAAQQFDASTGSNFRARFTAGRLRLTSSADEAIGQSEGQLTEASASALLDSFASCVADTLAQFRLSLQTWEREQSPRLRASRVEALRGECRSRFADDALRAEDRARREMRLQQIGADLAALPALSSQPLPSGVSLVNQPCSPS